MIQINWLALGVAAIVPLLVGFVWYNPSVMGKAWMHENNLTEEKLKNGNMAVIFGLTFLFSFFIALVLNFIVNHQFHVYSIVLDEASLKDKNSELSLMLSSFIAKYGNNFRTFKHGAFHGLLTGLLFVMPLVAINALFERRSFKYIAIHTMYWTICTAIMGGIICQWQ